MDLDTTWYGDNLGPGQIVLDGDGATPKRGTASLRHFSAHASCDQTVAHLSYCWALVTFDSHAYDGNIVGCYLELDDVSLCLCKH